MIHLVFGASGYIGSSIYNDLKSKGHKVVGTKFSNSKENDNLITFDVLNIEHDLEELVKHLNEDITAIYFAMAPKEREIFEATIKNHQIENVNYLLQDEYVRANSQNIIKIIERLSPKLKNSNLIFIGSLVGKKALNAPFAYTLGKSCLNGLVETLSKDLGFRNIKVNSVDPGMLEGGVSKFICSPDKEDYLKHCALSRFGKNSEVAKMCTWLGEKNTFITGKSFVLDGAL